MRKTAMIFVLVAILFESSFAQKLPAIFEKYEHDFGYIYEENGAVSYDFIFKSNSTSKLVIVRAKASCGCTSPDWSKDSIPSRGNGFVRVSYNPLNRPGPFRKGVKVTFSGDTTTQEIFIKGIVILKPKNSGNLLSERIGSLKLKSRYLHFGNIKNNQSTVREFELLNEATKPLKLMSIEAPKWIRAQDLPIEIAPKEKISMKVSLDPRPKNDLGYSEDLIELITNDDSIPSKQLVISAVIEEYFPPLSEEEMKSAPKIFFPKSEYETWKIQQGNTVSTQFLFTNQGKKDLMIMRVKTNCSCTSAESDVKTLKPGESSTIKVAFQTDDREGWEEKLVTVYSNDPQNPVKILKIRASIVK